jgi:hypothetical protein
MLAQLAPGDLDQDLVVADQLEQDDAAEKLPDVADLDRRALRQQAPRTAPALPCGNKIAVGLVARRSEQGLVDARNRLGFVHIRLSLAVFLGRDFTRSRF